MPSLRPNLVKRIERLPKPSNATMALQPLFEAISNAIHSTQTKFGENSPRDGMVTVTISTSRDKEKVWATVEDNGHGLDSKNWEAFKTTDTDNKIAIGGKGVGRLMWLDCFERISVISVYFENELFKKRTFDFVLSMDEQIKNETETTLKDQSSSMFFVRFEGLRSNKYFEKFPGRDTYLIRHFTSHFLPTFIGGRSPKLSLIIGDETHHYPEAINEIVKRRSEQTKIDSEKYGEMSLVLLECAKSASADMTGHNFVHFIAHDRTVKSQPIDGKLGLKYFGSDGNSVFHAILTGKFLDDNVNQERTA